MSGTEGDLEDRRVRVQPYTTREPQGTARVGKLAQVGIQVG